MKRLFALLPLFAMLIGCATPATQKELLTMDYGSPPTDHEATVKKYFDGTLFDPYSAQYDFGSPQQFWVKDAPLAGGRISAGYMVRVSINAKNRYGAYVGKKMYGVIIKNDRVIKVMHEFELNNLKMQ